MRGVELHLAIVDGLGDARHDAALLFFGDYFGSRDRRILYTSQLIDDKDGRLVVRLRVVRQGWLYGANDIDRGARIR